MRLVENVSWLFFDKALRMGIGLLVGVWVARYLGPDQFGLFNYVLAFVGLFSVIAGLGLQDIVVRNFISEQSCKEETMGTAAFLMLFGSILAYGCLILSIYWLRPQDTPVRVMTAILGLVILFNASQVSAFWFESQILSKYIVWVQSVSFIVFAAVKIILILNQAALVAFAFATMLEALMAALLMILMLNKKGIQLLSLRLSYVRAKSLLKDSWPLLFSGVAIIIYMKIDQVMLGQMVGDHAVGIYSAAVRISEVWYFAISIFMASVFPNLAKDHAIASAMLPKRWVQVYRAMFWLSLLAALIITLISRQLVEILYGNAYKDAVVILSINVWAGINVAVGSVWSKWLLLENKLYVGLYGHLAGALLNVLLNLMLIPKYGAVGAAIATLISYWMSAIFSYSLYEPKKTFGYIFEAIFFRRYKWS